MIRAVLNRLIASVSGRTDPPPSPPDGTMPAQHREVILQYARGALSLRDDAVAIHRYYIPILGVRGSPEMRYMAEVDNPSPDIALRRQYREILVGRAAA